MANASFPLTRSIVGIDAVRGAELRKQSLFADSRGSKHFDAIEFHRLMVLLGIGISESVAAAAAIVATTQSQAASAPGHAPQAAHTIACVHGTGWSQAVAPRAPATEGVTSIDDTCSERKTVNRVVKNSVSLLTKNKGEKRHLFRIPSARGKLLLVYLSYAAYVQRALTSRLVAHTPRSRGRNYSFLPQGQHQQ